MRDRCSLPPKADMCAQIQMSALCHKRTSRPPQNERTAASNLRQIFAFGAAKVIGSLSVCAAAMSPLASSTGYTTEQICE